MLDYVRFVIDITDAPDFIDGISPLNHQMTGVLCIREAHLELEDHTPDDPLDAKAGHLLSPPYLPIWDYVDLVTSHLLKLRASYPSQERCECSGARRGVVRNRKDLLFRLLCACQHWDWQRLCP